MISVRHLTTKCKALVLCKFQKNKPDRLFYETLNIIEKNVFLLFSLLVMKIINKK